MSYHTSKICSKYRNIRVQFAALIVLYSWSKNRACSFVRKRYLTYCTVRVRSEDRSTFSDWATKYLKTLYYTVASYPLLQSAMGKLCNIAHACYLFLILSTAEYGRVSLASSVMQFTPAEIW